MRWLVFGMMSVVVSFAALTWWFLRPLGGNDIIVDFGSVVVDPEGANQAIWQHGRQALYAGVIIRARKPSVVVHGPINWQLNEGGQLRWDGVHWEIMGGTVTLVTATPVTVLGPANTTLSWSAASKGVAEVRGNRADMVIEAGRVEARQDDVAVVIQAGRGLMIIDHYLASRLVGMKREQWYADFEDPEINPAVEGWHGGTPVAISQRPGSLGGLAPIVDGHGQARVAYASGLGQALFVRRSTAEVWSPPQAPPISVHWFDDQGAEVQVTAHQPPAGGGWWTLNDTVSESEDGVRPGTRMSGWALSATETRTSATSEGTVDQPSFIVDEVAITP